MASLIAVAATFKDDPTTAAAILPEVVHIENSMLWSQAAADALHTGIAEVVLRGHKYAVVAAAFSPDGTNIVTGCYDQTARIWNADGSGAPHSSGTARAQLFPHHRAALLRQRPPS